MWLFCPVEQVLFLHVDFICGPKLLPVFSMMMMTCAERDLQCESKNYPHEVFWHFFPNGWEFLVQSLHAYYTFLSTLEYKFLFNYLQLWLSYAILSATTQFPSYAQCPPSAKTHAFRCLRKSLIALLIVVCGKSSQICCSALLALGWSLALTEVCEMLEASHTWHMVVEWVECMRSGEFGGHWSFAQFVVVGYFTHS